MSEEAAAEISIKSHYPGNFLDYAKELGAHAVLEKPVSRIDLLKTIEEMLVV